MTEDRIEFDEPKVTKKKVKSSSPKKAPVAEHLKALEPPAWQHSAASALHGWAAYEHNQAKPFECSQEDYRAALEAAAAPNPKPHPGASAL